MSNDPASRCRNRLGLLFLVLAAGLAAGPLGCSEEPGEPTRRQVTPDATVKPGRAAEPAPKPVTAEEFARGFLEAVSRGEAEPAMLSTTFMGWVAPPVLPVERERGFSTSGAAKWLGEVGKGGRFSITSTADVPEGKAFRGEVSDLGEKKQFGLRVIRGEGAPWAVDWFRPTSANCTGMPSEGPPEMALARSKAAHFLDVLLDRDYELADRLMAKPLKEKMGGSPTATDTAEGRTYDQGWLASMLRNFAGFGSSYAITDQSPDDDGAKFRVTVNGDAGERKLSLTVARAEGTWAVTELNKE